MNRRGFLTGAAKMLGGALALSVLPGEGVARAMVGEKVLWTPTQTPVLIEDKDLLAGGLVVLDHCILHNCRIHIDGSEPIQFKGKYNQVLNCYIEGGGGLIFGR
jgi:hypothetical protein